MPQSGPPPSTDKEYLIEIYNIVGNTNRDLAHIAERVATNSARLTALEEKAQQVRGGFLLTKFALALVAPIGALAGWLGSRMV